MFISHVNRIRAQKTKEYVLNLSTNEAFKRFKLKTYLRCHTSLYKKSTRFKESIYPYLLKSNEILSECKFELPT